MKGPIQELELRTLYFISLVAGEALKLEQALEGVLGVMAREAGMGWGAVLLAGDDPAGVRLRASHGLSFQDISGGAPWLPEGAMDIILSAGRPFMIPERTATPVFADAGGTSPLGRHDQPFCLGAPIPGGDKPAGLVMIDAVLGREASPDRQLRFLAMVAGFMGQIHQLNLRALERESSLRRRARFLEQELAEVYHDFAFVGQSRSIAEVRELLTKVAPSRASVLLLGEAGVGKALVARTIHHRSERGHGPFIRINCAALEEQELESRLFGHVKGAFPGAGAEQVGCFELAHLGTVYLAHIDHLPQALQAKLLRFLQDREFEPLGSSVSKAVDVRLIAAAAGDLQAAVERGRFREDLYYRLSVFPLHIPPLRERKEDVPLLLEHYLERLAHQTGCRLTLESRAMEVLSEYDWPGNVAELANLMERQAIAAEGSTVGLPELPAYVFATGVTQHPVEVGGLSRLEGLEKREVLASLERNRWVQSHAANELGMTLRQLSYRIKKFGLEPLVRKGRQETAGAESARMR